MKAAKTTTATLTMFSFLFLGWIQRDISNPNKVVNTSKCALGMPHTLLFITGGGMNFSERTKEAKITLNYTKLILSKDQYDKLSYEDRSKNPVTNADRDGKMSHKKNVMVFQFAYLSELYPYPTLRAFPMRVKDQRSVFGVPVDLDYESSKPAPDLSVCTDHITGDLQIAFSEMELLKKESNPRESEKYQYFLFTPKFDDVSQHVYFEVSVFPSTSPDLIPKTRIINPSPPYGGA